SFMSFDGSDITRWPAYKYQLDSLILSQPHLNEVEKAFYVRSSLRSTALSLVSSIPTTQNFLQKIIDRLEKEYGRQDLTQATLLQSLLRIRSKSIRLEDQLDAVRSMINIVHTIDDSCGLNGLVTQQQIADRVHSRFIALIWRRKSDTLLGALQYMEDTIRTELEDVTITRAISERHQGSVSTSNNSDSTPNHKSKHTAVDHPRPTNGKSPKGPTCVFCGKHAYSGECTSVKSIKDRIEILKQKSLCFCCFSNKHATSACVKKCGVCSGKHNKAVCEKAFAASSNTVTALDPQPDRLYTARAVLTNPDDPDSIEACQANIHLDHGSQVTLITRDMVTRLSLVPIDRRRMVIHGIDNKHSAFDTLDIVRVGMHTNRGVVHIEAVVREGSSINTVHTHALSDEDINVVQSAIGPIPSRFSKESIISTDMLLSVGDTLELLENSIETRLPCGYRLVQSSIGPIIAGSNKPRAKPFNPVVSALTAHTEETLEQKIERMFSVDPAARVYETTEKEARKNANEIVNKHFDDTVQKQGDEYVVQYSLKPEATTDLPSNYDLAVSRLADVEKAFLQVKLHQSQRNMLRFLWLKDLDKPVSKQNIVIFRFCVTPFGVNASPSILNKVIHHHIKLNSKDCCPKLIHQLISNLYVDNVIINVDQPLSYMYSQSKFLFDSMSMNLRDFASNDQQFIDNVPDSDRAKNDDQKLLGLQWNTRTDQLPIRISISDKKDKMSKRTMLTFSDASKQAMADCVYSWSPNTIPSLLISKTRLAPIRSNSIIPKMELESLVMGHALIQFTVETLRKEFPSKEIHVYSYSDSAVVLHWCKPEFCKPVGVFVSNRTKKINEIRDQLSTVHSVQYHHPRHVRSEYNPADHATRGLSANEVNEPTHQWWIGPEWLKNEPNSWPNYDLSTLQCPSFLSFPSVCSTVVLPPPMDIIIDLSRFSSFRKVINVTATVFRFISICASKHPSIHEKLKHLPDSSSPYLTASEKR
ncbi:hypothetical protein PMAYCL1PPCAC_00655, partial [Pristionchus mayeri]